MAKVTSASTRSKRSTKKPVTQGQNPQRANRQAASTARVSQSGGGTPGSAKVTTGGGGAMSKPSGRQPRAITNGNSPAMRQIRAKAVEARRMAQGKSTVASRNTTVTPTNARGERIRSMAKAQRTIGDSGQVRAAQARGKAEVAKAQARRGAKQAMQSMGRTLSAARTLRNVAGAARMAGPVGAAAAVMAPRPLGDGTLTAAMKRGDYKPNKFENARAIAFKKAAAIKGSPVVGPKKSAAGQFDSAFAAARKAGKSTFTWKGKKYTTQMK